MGATLVTRQSQLAGSKPMTCHFSSWRHAQMAPPYCRSRYFKRQHKELPLLLCYRDQYTQQQDRFYRAREPTATINGFQFPGDAAATRSALGGFLRKSGEAKFPTRRSHQQGSDRHEQCRLTTYSAKTKMRCPASRMDAHGAWDHGRGSGGRNSSNTVARGTVFCCVRASKLRSSVPSRLPPVPGRKQSPI